METYTACTGTCAGQLSKFTIQVTAVVYLMGLISFLGWFMLMVFGGAGLAALPMDYINAYVNRPTESHATEKATKKASILDRARRLKDVVEKCEQAYDAKASAGKKMSSREAGRVKKLKAAVYFLERDWEIFKDHESNENSPCWYLIYLLVGIFSTIISICWLLHVILYLFADATPFLNTVLIEADRAFPLFGTLLYAVFSFYLLACCIKGEFKVGITIPFFELHPMKFGATYINSFLFNVLLVLWCSVAVVHFCAQAFNQYANFTTISLLFGNQIQNLQYISIMWQQKIFLYIMVGFSLLSLIYLLLWPDERKFTSKMIEDEW